MNINVINLNDERLPKNETIKVVLTKEHLDKFFFLFSIHNNNSNIFVLLFDNDPITTAVLKLCKKRQAMILKD